MMKKLALASLLALSAVGAHAGWVQVHAIPNVMTAYTDPALVQRNGDLVTIVMLYSLNAPQTNKAGTQFSSTRVELVFDCKNSQKHGKTVEFFTSKMAEGTSVQSVPMPVNWIKVAPSNDPSLPEFNYACKK